MKITKDLEQRLTNTLDSVLRQAYYDAMNTMIEKGHDPRQILATDYTKVDLSVDKIA